MGFTDQLSIPVFYHAEIDMAFQGQFRPVMENCTVDVDIVVHAFAIQSASLGYGAIFLTPGVTMLHLFAVHY